MALQEEPKPFVLNSGEGQPFAYLGGNALFKITNDQTGAWSLSIETFPAGFASALHSHPTEHSGFYILSGEMRIKCGEMDATVGAGGFVWLPRDVPHAFKVGDAAPRMWLNVQGPTGDFRHLIEEMSRSGSNASPDAAARHNLQRLGPSPF